MQNLKRFTYLLLTDLMFRHLLVSMEMLLKLVKIFGPVIHSTLSAGPSVGVDVQAEQRCASFFPSFFLLGL